jgi:hypothetical protein
MPDNVAGVAYGAVGLSILPVRISCSDGLVTLRAADLSVDIMSPLARHLSNPLIFQLLSSPVG